MIRILARDKASSARHAMGKLGGSEAWLDLRRNVWVVETNLRRMETRRRQAR